MHVITTAWPYLNKLSSTKIIQYSCELFINEQDLCFFIFTVFVKSDKLTKIGQQPEEFVLEDGAVLILVVQFQDLNEVMEATGILGVLGFLEDGVELINLQGSLALVALSTELTDGLECGVQVAGTEQVSDVESINLTISLEVIDLKGKLNP